MELEVTVKTYPNGSRYLDLRIGAEHIGHVTEVDGGYLLSGKRKPVPTVQDAARQALDAKIKQCLATCDRLRRMREGLTSR